MCTWLACEIGTGLDPAALLLASLLGPYMHIDKMHTLTQTGHRKCTRHLQWSCCCKMRACRQFGKATIWCTKKGVEAACANSDVVLRHNAPSVHIPTALTSPSNVRPAGHVVGPVNSKLYMTSHVTSRSCPDAADSKTLIMNMIVVCMVFFKVLAASLTAAAVRVQQQHVAGSRKSSQPAYRSKCSSFENPHYSSSIWVHT